MNNINFNDEEITVYPTSLILTYDYGLRFLLIKSGK